MKSYHKLATVICLLVAAHALYAQGPPTPVNLVAQVKQDQHPEVMLTWQVPGPTMMSLFFKVYRSADDSTHFKLLSATNRPGYHDEWVNPGHTYYYYVTSALLNISSTNISESPPSNIASATIPNSSGRPHGVITGTVVDSLTRTPLPFAKIMFFPISKPVLWIPNTLADSTGKYRAVLDTGTYLINAQAWKMEMSMSPLPPYRSEWYKDAADPLHATPVLLAENAEFVADFDLVRPLPPPLASISGTVTDSSGHPLVNATVVIVRTMQEMLRLAANTGEVPGLGTESMDIQGLGNVRGVLWKGLTDSSGNYQAHVLAGNAYIAMAVKHGYLPEFYNNKTNPMDADIIRLIRDTTGIDFSLTPRPVVQNSVSGIVRDSNGVRVPSRIVVLPVQLWPGPTSARFEHTDSTGAYTITNVRPGKYFVLALPFSHYAPAFYKAGAYGVLRWQKADTVNIAISGDVTGIDIGVVAIKSRGFARLSGRIRSGGGSPEAANGSPIEGVNVLAQNAQGEAVGYGITDDTGAYTIDALPVGQLSVVIDRPGYLTSQDNVTFGTNDFTLNRDYTLTPLSPTSVPGNATVPLSYTLEQNYPNPFNPSTQITFSLPVLSNVTLSVYNLLGQEIAILINSVAPAGNHRVVWDGKDGTGRSIASGVYFYRLQASSVSGGETFSSMKRMVLVK